MINALRHVYGFECYKEDLAFCIIAKSTLLAVYGLTATLFLMGVLAKKLFGALLIDADLRLKPLFCNIAGFAILGATLPYLASGPSATGIVAIAIAWLVGGTLLCGGALLMLASVSRWRVFAQTAGLSFVVVAIAGAATPFVALQLRSHWRGEALADWTFSTVVWIMDFWGQPVVSDAGAKTIGNGTFLINVAPSCSGVEGLAMVTIFTLIYLYLFRSDLRFPRAFIILPIGLCLSWLMNSLRIAVLIQIGISGHPELAVGGFHSHAGWLIFTLLSLTIVLISQALPFFKVEHTTPAKPILPFLDDPAVVQILPFFVFMATALLASTFAEDAATLYPVRAVAMAAVLLLVWPYIRRLAWRIDPTAIAVGVFIAVYWVVFAPDPESAAPYAGFGAALTVLWIASRIVGTTVFVPIIEELFFRGYLLNRLAPKGAPTLHILLAVTVSTAPFAALHGRWIEAAVAGALFAWLRLRRDNLTDAIVAHMIANGLIASWAVYTQNWSAI
ncbi:MAG: exosortase E/protease, VPEID-CTERM system [Amylibacter sp.]|nr:exosortase E/protease, VPEID-CTERM system [Amylibacter sp.]